MTDLKDVAKRFAEALEKNRKMFADDYRQDAVRVAMDLKTRYGLVDARLTDAIFSSDVTLPDVVQGMIDGLNDMATALSKTIADKASTV